MWVATGNAGIHRYRNGTWTWFQPDTRNGSSFFTVTGMAPDTSDVNGSLVIATFNEGLWLLRSPDDPVRFEKLNPGDSVYDPLRHVRRDPGGGVYLFNGSEVIHYAVSSGFTHVLSNSDLSHSPIKINDLSGAGDGTLYLGTDDGIYIWRQGSVFRRISSFDGIGPSNIVQFIFVDNGDRVWYASQGYVGFYHETHRNVSLIPVEKVTPTPLPTPTTLIPVITMTPVPVLTPAPAPSPGFIGSIVDPVVEAVRAVLEKLGVRI
jgi:hypothetical protein